MQTKKKVIGNTILLAVVFGLTIYGVFHGEDLGALKESIMHADIRWLIPGIGLFLSGESLLLSGI